MILTTAFGGCCGGILGVGVGYVVAAADGAGLTLHGGGGLLMLCD